MPRALSSTHAPCGHSEANSGFLACSQVRKVAEENGVDVSASIAELEGRAKQVHMDLEQLAVTKTQIVC